MAVLIFDFVGVLAGDAVDANWDPPSPKRADWLLVTGPGLIPGWAKVSVLIGVEGIRADWLLVTGPGLVDGWARMSVLIGVEWSHEDWLLVIGPGLVGVEGYPFLLVLA